MTLLSDLISGNQLISDLNKPIRFTDGYTSTAELSRFANEHSMIVNLCLGNVLEVDLAMIFIGKLTLLKSFECSLASGIEYNRLQEQMKYVSGFQDITTTRFGAMMKFNR